MIATQSYLKVPNVCASLFKWIDGVGSAKASEIFTKVKGGPNAFTQVFAMKSPLTGTVKIFDCAREEAILNDCFDGEYSKFKTSCGLVAIIWNC
jgi:hypothetical protein